MYKNTEKIEWIKTYIKNNPPAVDIMNADFVDAYIEKFKPKHIITMYGANKCSELSKILKQGYDMNIFNRSIIGIHQAMWGFPKWVYVYEINCYIT